MYKRSRGALSILLAVSMIMALFAVAFPTQAYADDNYPDFSYLTTIYKSDGTVALTAEQAQSLARYFCEQLASYPDKIYIYDYTDNQGSNFQEIYGVFNEVVENTEYGVFYRNGGGGGASEYVSGTNKPKWYIEPNRLTISDPAAEYASIVAQLDDMTAAVGDDWTDAEIAMYFHDYISVNFDYDFTYAKHTVYEFLQETHEGVCDAYASLYSFLLNRLGIPCVKVKSEPNNHAWNIVNLDGTWYYVDITHDDSYHYGHPGMFSRDYFLNSREEHLNQRAEHEKLYTDPSTWDDTQWETHCGMTMDQFNIAPTASYSGFWNDFTDPNCATPILPYKGGWLYTEYNNSTVYVKLYDRAARTSSTLTSASSFWGYLGNFCVPAIAEDVVFFTTKNKIYGYYDGTKEEIATDAAAIYGMKVSNDKLVYYTADDPISQGTKHELDLAECVAKLRPTVTVSFISDGNEVSSTEIQRGTAVNEPAALSNKKDGFFAGWDADAEGTTPFDFTQPVMSDTEVYAKYITAKAVFASVALSDDLTLTYRIMASPEFNTGSGTVKFFIDGEEAVEYTFEDSKMVYEGIYEFPVNVSARQMDSVITGSITLPGYEGELLLDPYSVNKNLEDLAALGDEDLKPMIDATFAFGACSNAYLDGDNSTMSEEVAELIKDVEIVEKNEGDYTSSRTNDIQGLEHAGTTLLLRNKTAVRHYFNIDDTADINDYSFDLLDAPDGVSYSIGTKENMDNVFYVEINGIDPSQLGTKIKLRVTKGTETQDIVYSPCCYMFSMFNKYKNDTNYTSFIDLMKSMYLYFEKAVDFAA